MNTRTPSQRAFAKQIATWTDEQIEHRWQNPPRTQSGAVLIRWLRIEEAALRETLIERRDTRHRAALAAMGDDLEAVRAYFRDTGSTPAYDRMTELEAAQRETQADGRAMLADTVRAFRLTKVRQIMNEYAKRGGSPFPELEADGADAFAHGYDAATCPYATQQTVDAAGLVVSVTEAQLASAAAWRRGWQNAHLATITGHTALGRTRLAFWSRLNVCLQARGIADATYGEARDFWDGGYTDPERVACGWIAD